ncbi:MAG: hypothetical protein K0S65_3966 [Labilithrix sp.]|nr:hypothetical protein [Labilithrix sp.]
MSSFESEPLDPDIRDLLDAERPIDDPPAGVQGRVLATLLSKTGPAQGGEGGGGTPTEKPQPRPSSADGLLRRFGPLISAFALGGATVAAIGALREPDVKVVYVERASAKSSPSMETAIDVPAAPATAVSSLPNIVPPPKPVVSAALVGKVPSGDRLAAERALLDVARAGLASGESEKTFAALSRHEREFEHGTLEEEREALRVKALVMAGRHGEARTKGARFRERFPHSMMLRAVDSSLESIP